MTDRFQVGVIAATHGIRGDVKVFPLTDDPARFRKLKNAYVETRDGLKPVKISGVKLGGKFVVLHLEGYDTIEEASLLRQRAIWIDRKDAVKLPEGRWFIADLIGMKVYTDEEELLGTLTDVIKTGANDVYQVTTPEGKDVLIPVIDDCILDVQPEQEYMKVHLLPGLLDL